MTTRIEIRAGEETFVASGKVILSHGWKSIYRKDPADANLEADEKEGTEEDAGQKLPEVHEGDAVSILDASIVEGTTKPPSRYTPSKLLQAMKEIHKQPPRIGYPRHYSRRQAVLRT